MVAPSPADQASRSLRLAMGANVLAFDCGLATAAIFMAAVRPVSLPTLDNCERFLAKPVSMLKLVRTVRELLPA